MYLLPPELTGPDPVPPLQTFRAYVSGMIERAEIIEVHYPIKVRVDEFTAKRFCHSVIAPGAGH
jgi:hypothetical protein